MTKLNTDQKLAVECDDKHILCLAGAGTGKTFVMLERIDRLIKEGVSPSSILVLTFTNAAALEMKTRYMTKHKLSHPPEFRTFHAFCYNLLTFNKKIRQKLKYSKVPNIASDGAIKKIRIEAQKQTGIKISDKKLSGKAPISPKEEQDIKLLKKAGLKILKSRNLITFDILCYDVCKLFENDDECISEYKSKYKYIFVDEFQDTDTKQWKFVKSFENAHLFLTGDALQAIYAFRGATSGIIKSLAEEKDWTTIKLHTNYRCCENICNFANKFSKYADDSYRVDMEFIHSGGSVEIHPYTSYYGGRCDDDCLYFCMSAVNWSGTTAIICRTNKEVNYIQQSFKEAELSFSAGKKYEIAANILQSVQSDIFGLEWLASMLSSQEYSKFIRLSYECKTKGQEYTIDNLVKDFKYRSDIIQYVNIMKRITNKLESDSDILGKWIDIFNSLRIKCPYMPEDTKSNSDILRNIGELIVNNRDMESGVYIGTIHSVKGLEFDNVILVGEGGSTFPLTSEENCNLYYVGITRAKTRLDIFRSDK